MVERLATGLAVAVAALLVTASVALAQFHDGDSAAHSVSTGSLGPPTNPATTHGPCSAGLTASIVVSWTATTSSWADGYEVLGSLVSGGPYATVGTVSGVNTTSYTVTGLAFATTYHYVVRATKGNWHSAATGEVSRTTLSPLCL
ncbi:MAG TPA: fibronectin type III domain-containing protein [Acidimicrobiales bacterium]|nr:fibronectin type III domain-containing protein [Acidimicrobiales bacterium]